MDSLVAIVVCGLAGWRLGAMLSYEDGPGHVFARLRWAAGDRPGAALGFWASLLACIWCVSVWTTAAMYLLWRFEVEIIPALFAAMAVAIVVERHVRR